MELWVTGINEYITTSEKKRELHPVVFACSAMMVFLDIHPFFDGNGRTARLILAVLMLRFGFVPVVYSNFDRTLYIQGIVAAQDKNPGRLLEMTVNEIMDVTAGITLK